MGCIVHGVTKSQTGLRDFHCPHLVDGRMGAEWNQLVPKSVPFRPQPRPLLTEPAPARPSSPAEDQSIFLESNKVSPKAVAAIPFVTSQEEPEIRGGGVSGPQQSRWWWCNSPWSSLCSPELEPGAQLEEPGVTGPVVHVRPVLLLLKKCYKAVLGGSRPGFCTESEPVGHGGIMYLLPVLIMTSQKVKRVFPPQ